MEMLFLEDYQVGKVSRTGEMHVSADEIVQFACQWDPQPFHVDVEAARQSMHGGLIACSAHVFAVFTKLANTIEPQSAALAALGFDELRMVKPLRAGDRVSLSSECVEVRRSRSKPDRGIVRSMIKLTNHTGETVFTVISSFLVRARDGGDSES